MKNKWFVFGVLLLSIGIFVGLSIFQKNEQAASIPVPSAMQASQASSIPDEFKPEDSAEFIRPHSPRFGNEMARVPVVEWLDPECESCRAIHPAVKRLIAEYGDRVLFVIRFMPYHQGSMYAASALAEAKELGKFEQALTVLFEKQPEWGDHHKPRPDLIPTYLTKLGIALEKLDKATLIAKHGEKIRIDEDDGIKAGVKGTPSFFVNGKQLRELGESPLRAAIDLELASTKK